MAELKLPFVFAPGSQYAADQVQTNFDFIRQLVQDLNDKVEAFDDLVVSNTFTNTNKLVTDSTGNVVLPSNPGYVARTTGNANIFGDGNTITIPFNIEDLDRGGNYNNSTYIFTASVTGLYAFITNVSVDVTLASSALPVVTISTTSRDYFMILPASGISGTYTGLNITYAPMTAADTATFLLDATAMGMTNTGDINASFTAGFLVG